MDVILCFSGITMDKLIEDHFPNTLALIKQSLFLENDSQKGKSLSRNTDPQKNYRFHSIHFFLVFELTNKYLSLVVGSRLLDWPGSLILTFKTGKQTVNCSLKI